MKRFELNDNWTLRPADVKEIPESILFPAEGIVAAVPGTVHQDLLNAGLIDDPFDADNEWACQWVGEIDWLYSCRFEYQNSAQTRQPTELVFEGLDTVCEIFLNQEKIAATDNMFLKYRFPVESLLRNGENELKIYCKSATSEGKKREEKNGKLPVALSSERAYVRKAQYAFGWDWGPALPGCGIWKKVYLQNIAVGEIEALRFHCALKSETAAEVNLEIELRELSGQPVNLRIEILDQQRPLYAELIPVNAPYLQQNISLQNIQLWWPNGMGAAKLYQLRVSLLDEGQAVVDQQIKNIAFRSIALQTREKGENVFRFTVNGRPVFIKGANWIPADSFLPRIPREKYQYLLKMAQNAHLNMIRVWGGGIYESDDFYDFCDQLGLMVWQDFMFACGGYPETVDFLENIQEEFRQNIDRLQSHPCLAIWCGNNENEWGWYMDHPDAGGEMPGYAIYHQYLPEILAHRDPLRPYWPSTPFGDEKNPNSENSGNRHQWDIWSSWTDYTEVVNDKGKFISEFGFQGPANLSTLNAVVAQTERNVQGRIFEHHNKQVEGNERIFRFLSGHLPVKTEWKDFNYLAQLNQGFALQTCLEHWRGRWPATGGAIIWQLNDCWPVTSWALIDSALLPKPAYYFVKNAFAPQTLFFRCREKLALNLFNETAFAGQFIMVVDAIDLATGQIRESWQKSAALSPGEKKNIDLPDEWQEREALLVGTMIDAENHPVARNFWLAEPWKYAHMKQPDFQSELIKNEDGYSVKLAANSILLFVQLQSHKNLEFAEQGFIMLPGETKCISISGANELKINESDFRVLCLNQYLAEGKI